MLDKCTTKYVVAEEKQELSRSVWKVDVKMHYLHSAAEYDGTMMEPAD